MESDIILVTGGQRSGKSLFAERLALELSSTPTYVATAEIRDDEMEHRVALHRQRRGSNWTTIDEPLNIADHDFTDKTVLVDCVTLWAANQLFANNEDDRTALAKLTEQVDKLTSQNSTIIFVTNEIGLGGTSSSPIQRKFTDLQGSINQYIASKASTVYFVVSGIPVKIKDCK